VAAAVAYAGLVSTRGELEVICGPMFSGKTDALIARYERARSDGVEALAVKPERDSRHPSDRIVSHSGREIPATAAGSSDDVARLGRSVELLLIDEIQFFQPDLRDTVADLRAHGVEVVAVGLDRDFRREPFETTTALARDASRVTRLTGRCFRCGDEATLTQRLTDGVPAPLDAPRLLVGDAELYEPRCERCWAEERIPSGARARVREP
jgi:thymidine kinase